MTEPIKSDFWRFEVIERRVLDVSFEEPLTAEEARRAFKTTDDYDVSDEETLENIQILEVKPYV